MLANIVQEVSATQHGVARGDAGCAVAYEQRAAGVASPSDAGAGCGAGVGAAGLPGKPGPLGGAGAHASAAVERKERAEALWDVPGPPADGLQVLQQRAALAKGAHAGRTGMKLGTMFRVRTSGLPAQVRQGAAAARGVLRFWVGGVPVCAPLLGA